MDTICLKCEIITLLQDLRFAWDRGFPSVCYEIDNTQVVEVVCSSICPPPHQYAHLLLQNFQFINRKWHLSFIQIEREVNEATLTNVGVNQCQPFCTWTLSSLTLDALLLKDSVQGSFSCYFSQNKNIYYHFNQTLLKFFCASNDCLLLLPYATESPDLVEKPTKFIKFYLFICSNHLKWYWGGPCI